MTVVWVVVLGSLLGVGGFVAGPIVAVGSEAVWKQYIKFRANRPETAEVEAQIAKIRERFSLAYDQYGQIKDQYPSQQLDSIFTRLERSIRKVEKLEESRFSES